MNETAKEEYISIFNKYIKREGADALLKWLDSSDFFSAPASSRNHSNIKSGLCIHSINVYKRFLKLIVDEFGENYSEHVTDETIAICGLLHDLCKVKYYSEDERNVKVDGVWKKIPYYAIKDDLPYGHGEKSVYMISGFMKLLREEAMCINWHMGGFDMRVKGGSYTIGEAYRKYPIALLCHVADLTASYLDEEVY